MAATLFISASVIGTYILTLNRIKRMASIYVDCSTVLGKVANLLGVNDGPLGPRGWNGSSYPYDLTGYYLKAGVNFIRVHDLWGSADIDIVFPDFNRDPRDLHAYNFSSTDRHVSAMLSTGARVIFRLGYSWSDPPKNSPPSDYEKWAEVCLHIVKHYNKEWANGMYGAIKHWEIWNEPDIEQFWDGTLEEYFLLYETTARRIKGYDPSSFVGGPAIAYDLNFLRNFLRRCKERDTPLDFVSWHVYSKDPNEVYQRALAVRRLMDEYGFSDKLIVLTEWNIWKDDSDSYEIFRGPVGASFCASCLIRLQNASVNIANFYRGDSWPWGGLFNEDGSAGKAYYVMTAFKDAFENSVRVKCVTEGGGQNLATMATKAEDDGSISTIISNYGKVAYNYRIQFSGLSWDDQSFYYEVFSVDEKTNLNLLMSGSWSGDNLELSIDINPYAVHVIKLRMTQPATS
ncbi:MAG: GH39 family glycosyl hydrolase [Thermoproteota archaeon]